MEMHARVVLEVGKGVQLVEGQRRLDTITCDGNYYGLIAFHNTVKGVMYGESGFV